MPKIIKNGLEYSGVPVEVVTAWAPTSDPVQVKEPLMGNTDISEIGDGSITGAISELNDSVEELNAGLTGEDFSSEISVYSNRMVIDKIHAMRYSDGKHELFILGRTATTLDGSQSSMLLLSGSTSRARLISGTANCDGIPYFVVASSASNTNYINVRHSGLSSNKYISIQCTWYELP